MGADAVAPFVETFSENEDGQSNVEIKISVWDREEGQQETSVSDDFSPPIPGRPPSSLPYEVNVISFLTSG